MATIIDRRLNPRDKNLGNRQRFIERAREQVKRAVDDAINKGTIKDLTDGNVRVPVKGIDEPTFTPDRNTGNRRYVVPGNKDFVEGDTMPKPPQGGGRGSGGDPSDSGKGEDEFAFTLTRDEFLEFFFGDLELPDMVKKKLGEAQWFTPKRAGYTNSGNQAQFDVRATMSKAMGRRIALRRPKPDEILALEAELADTDDEERAAALRAEIEEKTRRIRAVPWIDPIDVRFRHFVPQPQPIAKAVMFCVLDVSGSMGEREKDIAKRFFMLLSILLRRNYRSVDIVFVRHHVTAEECNEHDFFYKKETGGTVVSSALKLVNQIITDRYPLSDWNIYVAQASDGDNAFPDRDACRAEIARLLPLAQYFAYLDIGYDYGEVSYARGNSDLWDMYRSAADAFENLQMRHVTHQREIWGVFKELFSKKSAETKK